MQGFTFRTSLVFFKWYGSEGVKKNAIYYDKQNGVSTFFKLQNNT